MRTVQTTAFYSEMIVPKPSQVLEVGSGKEDMAGELQGLAGEPPDAQGHCDLTLRGTRGH